MAKWCQGFFGNKRQKMKQFGKLLNTDKIHNIKKTYKNVTFSPIIKSLNTQRPCLDKSQDKVSSKNANHRRTAFKRPKGVLLPLAFLYIRFRRLSPQRQANRRNPDRTKFRRGRCRFFSELCPRSSKLF